jgi:predicted DNA-binding transcriptional regulator AlpA
MCHPSTKSESRLLREAQILERISVSKATFRRWRRSGYFPAGIQLVGRITVWRADVVNRFIESLSADAPQKTPTEEAAAARCSTNSECDNSKESP